jgi:hypothetical protein
MQETYNLLGLQCQKKNKKNIVSLGLHHEGIVRLRDGAISALTFFQRPTRSVLLLYLPSALARRTAHGVK